MLLRQTDQGGIGWEYSDMKGIKPACCDSGFISGVETIVHGGMTDTYINKKLVTLLMAQILSARCRLQTTTWAMQVSVRTCSVSFGTTTTKVQLTQHFVFDMI